MKRIFRTALLLALGVAAVLPATANVATATSAHDGVAQVQLTDPSDSDWPW
ncbi:hypothetical protein AB0J27_11455 [Micromonospora chokoriensis]